MTYTVELASLDNLEGVTTVEVIVPGLQGPPGVAGPAGIGSAWQQGAGVPGNGVGVNGDYYLNTSNGNIYGPKAAGAWGSIIFNIAQGQQGPAGAQGSAGAAGATGADGREVQLQTAGGFIQWRYVGVATWTNLVALSAITGPAGQNGSAGAAGADGREVELQKSATHVQWRYVGSATWANLIPLVDLTGPAGAQGAQGAAGTNGRTVLNGSGAPGTGTGADGDFYIDVPGSRIYGPKASGAWGGGTSLIGAAGSNGSSGTDGREVEFRTSGGYIQWRYEGEASWTDLIALTAITGPAGSAGAAGSTGATGAAGAAATIAVGTVTTGAAGSSATVTNTGSNSAAILAFSIPKGDTGAQGVAGPAGTTDYNALANKPTLGTAAATAATDYATAAQGTDSREWSATTIDQAEAEAGTATTRRAFTAQRVFQAVAAWWAASAAATKLAGIASGATANSSDAQLRDRSTHTGTQAASTITGLGSLATQSATLPSGAIVGATDTQTLTSKTLGNLRETTYTITDGAAFEIDPANGPIQTVTLGANRSPAATNFASGQSVKLKIDDGTAFAITWTTVGVAWISQTAGASGTAPTLSTTGWTHIELWKEGSIVYGALIGYSAT